MANPTLTITNQRNTRGHRRTSILNPYCDNSDGANFCLCQRASENTKSCMFYGRNLEPLAFSIAEDRIFSQAQCTLLTKFPIEIREMIWGYALTDTASVPARSTFMWRSYKHNGKPKLPALNIAFGLVQSCKAIYLETYRLPLQLNYYTVYDFQGPFRPDLRSLAPWQAALLQRIDISLQQMALERGELRNWLNDWYAKERQSAYVAPRFLGVLGKHLGQRFQPFPFDILSTSISQKDPKDGNELTLPIAPDFLDEYDHVFYEHGTFATHFSARAMLARPLTHLTLRMCHEDWWHWGDNPTNPTNNTRQLSLDPAVGHVVGSPFINCSVDVMEEFANKRRAGEDVQGYGTWGAIVGRLPDLKELKLVLETFDVKKEELEKVVECAKTWRFPIEDTAFELIWDGHVEDASWDVEPGELEKDHDEPLTVEEQQEEDKHEDDFSDQEMHSDYSDGESDDESYSEYDRVSPSPTPRSWNQLCTQFEVRVVRYTRRKMGRSAT